MRNYTSNHDRFKIFPVSCLAAGLDVVSVEHCKIQSVKLYLTTVKKVNYIQNPSFCKTVAGVYFVYVFWQHLFSCLAFKERQSL
jgi:hypothetical protein